METIENKESPSISYNPLHLKSMDYYFLRKEGIRFVQEMAGKIWTDYNDHDPGVTILEQCCFALTDIAYRTNIDIEKILFADKNTDPKDISENNCLFLPEEILLSSVVTLRDSKIFFLDNLKHVTNIWFRKSEQQNIEGLYDIFVQPVLSDKKGVEVEQEVRALFAQNRNLCEDINDVIILQPEDLEIAVTLDLYEDYRVEEVLAEMYFQLDSYFNNKITYNSIENLLAQGKEYDTIFNRPSINKNKGFINESSMHEYQTSFSFSKIQTVISEIKGVRNVYDLSVRKDGIKIGDEQIRIENGRFVSLAAILEKNEIVVNKNHIRIDYSIDKVRSLYYQKISEYTKKYFFNSSLNYVIKKNIDKNLYSYSSIQNTFPITYGIGQYGLSESESHERFQYARQLQSFLLFFDQILLNHLAQLENVSTIFSIDDNPLNKTNSDKTYFEKYPDEIPDISELIHSDYNDNMYGLIDDKYYDRKNKILDHLLARFSEKFVDRSHHNLKNIYGLSSEEEIDMTLVRLKKSFLKKYYLFSKNRNKAYNFQFPIWDSVPLYKDANRKSEDDENNYYIFKKKIFLLLNIPESNLRQSSLLSDYSKIESRDIAEKDRKDMIYQKNTAQNENLKYYKTYKEPDSKKVTFVLPEGQQEKDYLMYYGAQKENYIVSQDDDTAGLFTVFFTTPASVSQKNNDILPLALGSYSSVDEAEGLIDKLIHRFTYLNRKSEGFHVIEHILLRPVLKEQFELKLILDDLATQHVYMKSVYTDSYDGCKYLILEIINNGLFKDRFEVVTVQDSDGSIKYGIVLKDHLNNYLLELNTLFVSSTEAQQYIDSFLLLFFKTLSKDKSIIPPAIEINSIINEKIVQGDVRDIDNDIRYDSTISLVIPDWLPRFNDPDFRNLFQHSLVRSIPAHISVNQAWLNKNDMFEFEKKYKEWITLKYQIDFSNHTNVADNKPGQARLKSTLHEDKVKLDQLSFELLERLKIVR